jgi:hypothetical protein
MLLKIITLRTLMGNYLLLLDGSLAFLVSLQQLGVEQILLPHTLAHQLAKSF